MAGTADSGGSGTKTPVLIKQFDPGNIATSWSSRECRIFDTGVDLIQDGTYIQSKSLVPSNEIPNSAALAAALEDAKNGKLVPQSTTPDVGHAEYHGNLLNKEPVESVTLLIQKIDGLQNTSQSAQVLVNYIDQNCQFN